MCLVQRKWNRFAGTWNKFFRILQTRRKIAESSDWNLPIRPRWVPSRTVLFRDNSKNSNNLPRIHLGKVSRGQERRLSRDCNRSQRKKKRVARSRYLSFGFGFNALRTKRRAKFYLFSLKLPFRIFFCISEPDLRVCHFEAGRPPASWRLRALIIVRHSFNSHNRGRPSIFTSLRSRNDPRPKLTPCSLKRSISWLCFCTKRVEVCPGWYATLANSVVPIMCAVDFFL